MGPTQSRYHEAIQKKVEDQEITVAPEAQKAQIVDLVEALKASLAAKGEGQAEPRATTESDDQATGTEG